DRTTLAYSDFLGSITCVRKLEGCICGNSQFVHPVDVRNCSVGSGSHFYDVNTWKTFPGVVDDLTSHRDLRHCERTHQRSQSHRQNSAPGLLEKKLETCSFFHA